MKGHRLSRLACIGTTLFFVAGLLAAGQEEGRRLFAEHCQQCHSIARLGLGHTTKVESMQGPDMGQVPVPKDRQALVAYLQRRTQRNGKLHRGQFKGTREQLGKIIDWNSTYVRSPTGGGPGQRDDRRSGSSAGEDLR